MRCFWKRHYATLLAGPVLLLLGFWMFAVEPGWVHWRERRIDDPTPDGRLDGFTIALLSDLHIDDRMLEKLPELVAKINARRPDLILLGGDFVNGDGRGADAETLTEPLRVLHAPCGVFAVPGNHDYQRGLAGLEKALAAANIRMLYDEAVVIGGPRGDALNLIGFDYRDNTLHQAQNRIQPLLSEKLPNLVLTHTPDVFPDFPDTVFLTLAGHTHGGQLTLPFFGALLCPARNGRRYIYGEIDEAGKKMIVTSGLGASSVRIRLNMPPEVVFITLKAAAK